ncbi:MAG: hypothetical protein R3F49_18440 [Planctomycetota bacterium]
MRKFILTLAALSLVYFTFNWARRALRSDEEQIRRRLDHMVDGVNRGEPGAVLSGFDRERYRDEPSGLDTEDLRTALLYLFLQERTDLEAAFDPTDGLALELDLEADPPRAIVRFHCNIEEARADGTRRPWWDLRGVGVMERHDGEWRFVSSSDVDQSTRRRF